MEKDPGMYQEEIAKIFPGCLISEDGQRIDLAFESEEDNV
jgi:hypothetical protein